MILLDKQELMIYRMKIKSHRPTLNVLCNNEKKKMTDTYNKEMIVSEDWLNQFELFADSTVNESTYTIANS